MLPKRKYTKYMKTQYEQLKEYNGKFNEWKVFRASKIMGTDTYRKENLGVEYDHRLSKGTMYKNLFPEVKKNMELKYRFMYGETPLDDDKFTEPKKIYVVQKILKLKQKSEYAEQAGDNEEKRKIDHAIKIELGRFKLTAPDKHLSPQTLDAIQLEPDSIVEARTKQEQCQRTLQYLTDKHDWFKIILEEIAEKGIRSPHEPKELIELQTEYDNLEASRQKKMSLSKMRNDRRIDALYAKLQTKKSEYGKDLREHYEYIGNNVYDLKENNYVAKNIVSTKRLEQIISLFAWFYKKFFWVEKKKYQEDQQAKRNANRKKSGAFEERRKKVQECKEKGLSKKQTEKETGLSYPTILKYWEQT